MAVTIGASAPTTQQKADFKTAFDIDFGNVTAPIVARETTQNPHPVFRHQPQAPTAGGYEFSFGYNGGAAFTQGPTVEPNYIDDVWWFGFNSSGADIAVDPTKPTFSLQFESKFAQGAPTDPFGSEFHLAFKSVDGRGVRALTTFMPHDLSTAAKRKGFGITSQTGKLVVQDLLGGNRLQAEFDDGTGVGFWFFGADESIRSQRVASAPFFMRNAANNADVPLPHIDADDRLRMVGAGGVLVGATPTGGTYPNTFMVLQATSIAANGTLFQTLGPAVTGAVTGMVVQMSASQGLTNRIYNTHSTSTSAAAVQEHLVLAGGGDAFTRYNLNGGQSWSVGLDVSDASAFVISRGFVPGSNNALKIDTNAVWFLGNAVAVPGSNPSGGGNLYVEAGALKYRGSAGTVTTLGAA
jgi:hypothetical protein